MEATLFSPFLDVRLFTDDDLSAFVNQVEQLNYVRIAHPDTAVAVRLADGIFVFRSMNVDESVTRICIVFFGSIQPQDSRRNKIFRIRERIVRGECNPRFEDRSRLRVVTDLLHDPKSPERRFETARFSTETEARARDRIRSQRLAVAHQCQLLIPN